MTFKASSVSKPIDLQQPKPSPPSAHRIIIHKTLRTDYSISLQVFTCGHHLSKQLRMNGSLSHMRDDGVFYEVCYLGV